VFKIATFNANSIRSRVEIVKAWLEKEKPDCLCLQETKVQDGDFPASAFGESGWHVVFRGEKSYNGVAIASRVPSEEVSFGIDDGGPADETRIVRARISGVEVINTYVPQGRSVDDPFFRYKIEWFGRIRGLLDRHYSPGKAVVWAGDLNVAPEAADVYDAKHLEGSVCFHPDERAALMGVLEWGLVDVFRMHNKDGGQFTFWDYRIANSVKRNLGWRLDHILATEALAGKSTKCWIDREPRLLPKPSDHTFLAAVFDA